MDTGVEQGDEISPNYDPMIAKLVAWGPDRQTAREELAVAACGTEVWPVRTNAPFLMEALSHEAFERADFDTGFIAKHESDLLPTEATRDDIWDEAAWSQIEKSEGDWMRDGFRLNAPSTVRTTLFHEGQARTLEVREPEFSAAVRSSIQGDTIVVFSEGKAFEFSTANRGTGAHSAHDGDILAPMPGKVIAVDVAQGDTVTAGQRLLVLEAMKMEHALTAPFAGTVAELSVSEGSQVQVEALLARVEAVEGA
jgi:3-methylcrotonyl-CoA carboxylase alpha subunit